MADIPQAEPTTPPLWPKDGYGGGHSRGRQRNPYGSGLSDVEDETGFHPHDAVDVHGLNFSALPPEVQQVLETLMGEIEGLHQEVRHAEGRIGYLEQMVDQHAFMPILNRRAIMRELSWVAGGNPEGGQIDQGVPVGVLGFLYMLNFENLRQHFGLMVAEKALTHLARQLAGLIRTTDRVGSVGGAGMALVMPGADLDGVRQKLDQFLTVLSERPLALETASVPLDVRAGLVCIYEGDDPESLLAEADSLLRAET